jgi:hypothetical protein
MTIFYKFGFWTLLIIDLEKFKGINEKRISSLMVSNTISKRKRNPVIGDNIITHEICDNLFKDITLVILLSTFKCNKCQEKELERLNSLKK